MLNVKEMPSINVIIPTFNEEKRLKKCIDSVFSQDYPSDKIEIIVVDDDSTDNTINIAKEYGIKILRNGHHNIEIGKSIGLQHSKHPYILFLDADNVLPYSNWIRQIIEPLLSDKEIVGAEPIYFQYNRKDAPSNRYCSLFGINDPSAFYLGKRDRLMWIEKKWDLLGKVKDCGDHYKATFSIEAVPTIGSIGFLARKDMLLKTNYKPYFFHMDANRELIEKGFNKYILMKIGIIHMHCDSSFVFLKKLRRNIGLYLIQSPLRNYDWTTDKIKLAYAALLMITFIKPFYDSMVGYSKLRDKAWFLHPFFCFSVVLMYGIVFADFKIRKFIGRIFLKE